MALVGFEGIAGTLGISVVFVVLLMIWSLVWKGIALWKSGRNNQLVWFIVLLIVNTVGILEIVYLLWFQKKGAARKKARKAKKRRR